MSAPALELLTRAMNPGHQPVMLHEVVEYLAPLPGTCHLDCTFGGGGHTRAILATGASVVAHLDLSGHTLSFEHHPPRL